MSFDFDYFVLGAGSGGVRSARVAAAHGARVAIAEEYRVGGTCVIRGCVPKKLLVMGSALADCFADAAAFGWTLVPPAFRWDTLRDHVAAEVDRLNGLYQQTLDRHGVETFHSRATLAGAQRVRVNGREFSARHVLVATGAHPFVPALPGADLGVTSNEMFHLPRLPKRAIVYGGGFIANEFAGILHQLGVEVTIVLRSDVLLRGWDRGLVSRLIEATEARGLRYRFNATPASVEQLPAGGLSLKLRNGESIEGDLLLWATGRVPNSHGLGLQELGLELGVKGAIPVDAHSHTALPWLHAVGDVTNRIQLTPVAIREGHALADELFGGKPWAASHDNVPAAVFSQPPLAAVGLTEEAAKAKGRRLRIYETSFRPMQTSFTGGDERCFYKLVVDDESDRLLGAHLLGPEAPEILQALAIAVKAGLSKADVDETLALHPSMAEELVLLRDARTA